MSLNLEENAREEVLDQKVDTVLEETGRFGRYQWFLASTYFFNIKSTTLLIMSLAYQQKIPKEYFCIYQGSEVQQSCQPVDFCDNPDVVSFTPNMELEDSYDNWVIRFDLHCASNVKIGFITASFFIGWTFTLAWLSRISDLFGRQKLIIIGTMLNFMAFLYLLICNSYTTLIVCMATFGMTSTIRMNIGVTSLYEYVKREDYAPMYAVITLGDGVGGLLLALYFMTISKNS